MRPVEPHGVRGLEPGQGLANAGSPTPDQQVIVVLHHHEGVNLLPKTPGQFGHQTQKSPTFVVGAVKGLPAISQAHDVVPPVGNVVS